MRKVTKEEIDALMAASTFTSAKIGQKTTVVCMTLPNGFELIESSGCVCAENYDQALGVEISKKRIIDKLWFIEGYRLQCDLAAQAIAEKAGFGTYQDRVRYEKQELGAKIEKLKAFIGTERFCALDDAEQTRMDMQLQYMQEYSGILSDRIDHFK